jgi:nucleoside-diphosphate-sugar epimerase
VNVGLTGGTGFVGRRLAARLAADGHALVALVRPGDEGAPLESLGARLISGEITDPDAVQRVLAGADVVFHLAGLVPTARATRGDYRRVNAEGTRVAAEAAVRAGVRHLVHCSSVGVYGIPRRAPADESTPPRPLNAYQASKLDGERTIASLVAGSATSATIARPTALYGPGDLRSLGLLRSVARGRVRLVGDGENPCQLMHVDDAIDLLRACGARRGRPGEVELLVLAPSERLTVRGLIEALATACAVQPRLVRIPRALVDPPWRLQRATARFLRPPPGWFDGLDFFLADRTADGAKARRVLDVEAQRPLAAGLRDAVDWARERALL